MTANQQASVLEVIHAMELHVGGVDLAGYVGAGLVLATFCMRNTLALRYTAVASNLAFITYGLLSGVGPVLALHLLLLPINVAHLLGAARRRAQKPTCTVTRGDVTGDLAPGCLISHPQHAHRD